MGLWGVELRAPCPWCTKLNSPYMVYQAGGLEARKILLATWRQGSTLSNDRNTTEAEMRNEDITEEGMETEEGKKSDTNSTSASDTQMHGTDERKPLEVSACGSAVEEVAVVFRAASNAEWVAYKLHGAAQLHDEKMVTQMEEKGMTTSVLKFAGKETDVRRQ